ncbi:hypothetical protein PMAYCL1PPCAC_00401 [Pristionchus mayeri]|uniref:Neurotransmitter-gated ion-channel ligand-binding domain-containing protein n=1 Tax=Pristionchus mayeri TaxID=1317129 RepID=A0AAN4Z0E7_9BILA|nr:hypothetical protein PMAYCL1PPCAC_00401 [Pristionchus mayeri]
MIILLFLHLLLFSPSHSHEYDKSPRQQLIDNLFNGYDYKKGPPKGTTVATSYGVQHVFFPYEDSPLAVLICTMSYSWEDARLQWNPRDYDGIMRLSLPANHKLWTPQSMTNMDGKNHRISSTAHKLRGIELEVKDAGRTSVATVTFYRRVQLEMVCENERIFPTVLKCIFRGVSKDDISVAKWAYVNGNRLKGFMDDNITGSGIFEIESVHGIAAGKYNRAGKENNEISMCVRLKSRLVSSQWILCTAFLSLIALLVLLASMLPPRHEHLHAFVIILVYLLMLLPSQLIFSIKSYSSFSVPPQTRVYAILFVLSTFILPFQQFFNSEYAKEKSVHLLSLAQGIGPLKQFHSKMYPYTKDFELPFMCVLFKAVFASVFTVFIVVMFVI